MPGFVDFSIYNAGVDLSAWMYITYKSYKHENSAISNIVDAVRMWSQYRGLYATL